MVGHTQRRWTVGVALLAVGLLATAMPPEIADAGQTNPAPIVVPSIREWTGGRGTVELTARSRIVVEPAGKRLAADARRFGADLAEVTGLRLAVVTSARPRKGDIALSPLAAEQLLGSEGYRLTVDDQVSVRANTETGAFYGLQTILQVLRTTPGHRSVPRGIARDWPSQRQRGFLLDVGRKYWSMDYLEHAIRELAYLKLNTLHLHFTDNNAFRLVSDRFPYLAAPHAYSKADLRRLEETARRNHVRIVPEIEMPAHSAAILKTRPDLAFDCPEFSSTLNVTKPEVREFTTALIDEFAPLFAGRDIHLATDEYPRQDAQQRCPELVDYAAEHGFASTADVFVDFINEMNDVVRSHGKRTVIWNWWDVDQDPTIHPDRDIKVEVWTTGAETGEDHSPQTYLDLGYEVVVSPSDTLYVTPYAPHLPDAKFLYERWNPLSHPRVLGHEISIWADNAIDRTEDYFDAQLRRPREVLADRLWGGPRRGTAADFFRLADAIGTPPGVAGYELPGRLAGVQYGTSPAWDNSSSTFDKAFDGDPITTFLYAQPNGGYTGIDLGAMNTSAVSLVRFFPRGANDQDRDRTVGGQFQGCVDGPTSGCRTLATIDTRPAFGWNELAVSGGERYRWLRYLSPDGGYASVAEVEFIAPPEDGSVRVEAASALRTLGRNAVEVSYRNNGPTPVRDVRLDLEAYASDDRAVREVRATSQTSFPVVAPGATVSSTWQVDVPLESATGAYHLVGRAVRHATTVAAGHTRTTLAPALDVALTPDLVGLDAGDSRKTKLRIANHAARPVIVTWHEVRGPHANAGFTVRPTQGQVEIPAGGTASVPVTATASADAHGPTRPLPVYVSVQSSGAPRVSAGSVELRIHSRTRPYLSDLDWTEAISEWSTVTRDTYVGSEEPMTLNGVRYAKGLGAAGDSRISFALGKKCERMTAMIGIDDAADSTTDGGTAHFFVYVDRAKVFESGLITRQTVESVDVDLTGADSLSLVTDNAGDGFDHDAVNWADASLSCPAGLDSQSSGRPEE